MVIIRNVGELASGDRAAFEHLVGSPLRNDQQLIIQIVNTSPEPAKEGLKTPSEVADVPAWCNVLEGFSAEDLADFNSALSAPVRLARAAE